jgi:hypothetical protein
MVVVQPFYLKSGPQMAQVTAKWAGHRLFEHPSNDMLGSYSSPVQAICFVLR